MSTRSVIVRGVLLGSAAVAVTLWAGLGSRDDSTRSRPTDTGSGADTSTAGNAVVERVVDGDTLDIRMGRRTARVRLIGINTPETVDPRRPAECYGHEASELAKHLLPSGTPIRVERDVEARDDYDRLLAYVYRASDHLFVNLELLQQGAAVPLRIEPNTAYATAFADAAIAAEQAGRGLWSQCPR